MQGQASAADIGYGSPGIDRVIYVEAFRSLLLDGDSLSYVFRDHCN